jgi:hypothetical protein
MYDQSHCCVLARFDSRQTGEFKILANLLNFRQRAINTQGVSDCSDALCGVGASSVAIVVIPDAAQMVSGEVDACQRAIDAQSVGNCCDALRIVSSFAIIIDAAQLIV